MSSFPSNSLSASQFKQGINSFFKKKDTKNQDALNPNIKLKEKQTCAATQFGYKKYFVGAQDYQTSSNYFLAGDTAKGDTFTLYA